MGDPASIQLVTVTSHRSGRSDTMISKEEIGRRIKKVREEQHLTLKNVEAKAGISATHISEIERGKTSPTIGALVRIADALSKDPAYFIEEEELNDTSFVALEDRKQENLRHVKGMRELLTKSIPSGRINAQLITLAPAGSEKIALHSHEGDEAALVLKGKINFMVSSQLHELVEGDSIYYITGQEHGYINASKDEAAKMIWFASERRVE
jgi:transcriptional regulator with XRE-family HTH domain